jgi:hypothetical protein
LLLGVASMSWLGASDNKTTFWPKGVQYKLLALGRRGSITFGWEGMVGEQAKTGQGSGEVASRENRQFSLFRKIVTSRDLCLSCVISSYLSRAAA